jgi:hypothetical protein
MPTNKSKHTDAIKVEIVGRVGCIISAQQIGSLTTDCKIVGTYILHSLGNNMHMNLSKLYTLP